MNNKEKKKHKKITTTLEFQEIADPTTGNMYMAAVGIVIERKVDKDGIEIMDKDGKPVYEQANFIMPAEEIHKGMSDVVRALADEALRLKRENDEKENINKTEDGEEKA